MTQPDRNRRLGVALAAAGLIGLAIITTGHTVASAALTVSTTATSSQLATGVAPITSLPGGAQALVARADGNSLALVARLNNSDDLVLMRVVATGALSQVPLGLSSKGYRVGLGMAHDGTAWIGVNNVLARTTAQGAVQTWQVPAALSRLPFAGSAAPAGLPPLDDGQVTAVAVDSVGRVLIGRAGMAEITRFDPASETFRHLALPRGLGDVEQFADGPGGSILFTVNHSATAPGILYDRVGVVEPADGAIRGLNIAARSVTATSTRIVAAGVNGLGWFDAAGAPAHAGPPAGRYDDSRIVALSDDAIAVRALGGINALVLVGPSGTELKRIDYQVPIVMRRDGTTGPYASALVFLAVAADGSVWFGLYGTADIYRVQR